MNVSQFPSPPKPLRGMTPIMARSPPFSSELQNLTFPRKIVYFPISLQIMKTDPLLSFFMSVT